MTGPGKMIDVKPKVLIEPAGKVDEEDWQSYYNAGMDFPVVNFDTHFGKAYNHFWSCGFGTVVADRYIKE